VLSTFWPLELIFFFVSQATFFLEERSPNPALVGGPFFSCDRGFSLRLLALGSGRGFMPF